LPHVPADKAGARRTAEETRAAIQRATVAARNAASAAREAWQAEMAKPPKSEAREQD
jgi:hypothetical protein